MVTNEYHGGQHGIQNSLYLGPQAVSQNENLTHGPLTQKGPTIVELISFEGSSEVPPGGSGMYIPYIPFKGTYTRTRRLLEYCCQL